MNRTADETITMEHGAGGESMQELIRHFILHNITGKSAGTVGLDSLDDGATVRIPGNGNNTEKNSDVEIVVTTDSYVIKPVFFPGGDIGHLAVCGTVNDLAVMGAAPLALTCAFVIPEGFDLSVFEQIVKSMNRTAEQAAVPIITGDTKTIEKSGLDSIIINTTGIGTAENIIRDNGLRPGDKIIISGTVGDHGISLLAHREGFNFDTQLVSDAAPLWDMIKLSLPLHTRDGTPAVSAMKDPTRGGLASALNEMAKKSRTGIIIDEKSIPVKKSVASACEMLGIDPLEVANEGKVVMGVRPEFADEVISLLKSHRLGKDASVIGEVTGEHTGRVLVRTMIGGKRFMDMPSGDPIPRVC